MWGAYLPCVISSLQGSFPLQLQTDGCKVWGNIKVAVQAPISVPMPPVAVCADGSPLLASPGLRPPSLVLSMAEVGTLWSRLCERRTSADSLNSSRLPFPA